MHVADCAALRASEPLHQFPLRRLYPLLLASNLLRNSMLLRSSVQSTAAGAWANRIRDVRNLGAVCIMLDIFTRPQPVSSWHGECSMNSIERCGGFSIHI